MKIFNIVGGGILMLMGVVLIGLAIYVKLSKRPDFRKLNKYDLYRHVIIGLVLITSGIGTILG